MTDDVLYKQGSKLMELPDRSAREVLHKSKHPSNELPLELQSLIKSYKTNAIIMGVISLLTIYLSPFAIYYFVIAGKIKPEVLPNRELVKWSAILGLPLCLGLIPLLIDVEFWRMNRKLKEFDEKGAEAFKSDKEFLVGEPKRKKRNKITWIILLSIIAIFVVLIIVAIASSSSDSGTSTTPTATTPSATITPEIQVAKDKMDSLTAQYKQCSSDLVAREPNVDRYSQNAIDAYNADYQTCENVRLKQNAAVDSYNSLIGQ